MTLLLNALKGTTVTAHHSENGSVHRSPQELLLVGAGVTPTSVLTPNSGSKRQGGGNGKKRRGRGRVWRRRKTEEGMDEWGSWEEPAYKKDRGEDKEGQRHDRASATTTSRRDARTFWLTDPTPKPIEKEKAHDDKDKNGAAQSSWMRSMGKKFGGEGISTHLNF